MIFVNGNMGESSQLDADVRSVVVGVLGVLRVSAEGSCVVGCDIDVVFFFVVGFVFFARKPFLKPKFVVVVDGVGATGGVVGVVGIADVVGIVGVGGVVGVVGTVGIVGVVGVVV